jgi:hypothetical protein
MQPEEVTMTTTTKIRKKAKVREPLLDPELVLRLCKKFSGYDGAMKALRDEGFVNPSTNKPFTKHALIYASKKANGYDDWRIEREKERANVVSEFKRIAKVALANRKEKAAETK